MKLECEIIPKSSFFKNVRSEVSKEEWDVLRRDCYRKANYRCEICDGVGSKWPVECHEVWNYKKTRKYKGIQKLIRLIALCPDCHRVKHPGLANIRGEGDLVVEHLMKVNGISKDQALDHLENSWVDWHHKNMIEWKLDLNNLGEIINENSKR